MDSIWCQGAGSISIKIMQNFQQFAIFSKRKKSDYYMADYGRLCNFFCIYFPQEAYCCYISNNAKKFLRVSLMFPMQNN